MINCEYMVCVEQPASEPAVLSANLATVAILPVSDDVPLKNFTKELHHALSAIGGFY